MEITHLDEKYENSVFVVKESTKVCVYCKIIYIIVDTEEPVEITGLYNGFVSYRGCLVATFGTTKNSFRYTEFTGSSNITINYREFRTFTAMCNVNGYKSLKGIGFESNDLIEILGSKVCDDYSAKHNIIAKDVIFDFHSPIEYTLLANQKIKIRKIDPSIKDAILGIADHKCEFIE